MATNKYNDVEIKTAENLLKCGYKWIARNRSRKLLAFHSKPSNRGRIWLSDDDDGYYFCEFVPIFQNISFVDKEPTSLESILHPQILDDAERRYLSAVIRPFRSDVTGISKNKALTTEREQIRISIRGYNGACLPWYDAGTMYIGMEQERLYTLKELGL